MSAFPVSIKDVWALCFRWFSVETCIGFLAIVIWASSPLVNTLLARIPVFELLSYSLWLSGLIGVVRLTWSRRWSAVFQQPWYVWCIGFVGIYSNEVSYVSSLKFAPASHINVINWLWPVMVLVWAKLFLKEDVWDRRVALAALCAFVGVCVMVSEGHQLQAFHPYFAIGYALALLAALIWSGFTVVSRRFKDAPHEMVHLYCGIASVCSMGLHHRYETHVVPNVSEYGALFVMGFAISGMAYYFWDRGIKKGNLKQLTIMSYSGPIFSLLLLLAFHQAQVTLKIVMASALVLCAALLVRERVDSSACETV